MISYRTGADPAIVRHQGAYYLFETLADGYWRSDDLVRWRFVTPNRWPFRGVVAPAALSDGDALYLTPSATEPSAILVSKDPAHGKFDFLTRRTRSLPGSVSSGFEEKIKPGEVPPGPWDPALFKDDDGRWYLYWNSSNAFPLYGIELDPQNKLSYIGKPLPLISLDPTRHGWERFGQDHSGGRASGEPIAPFIEGAWMTKVGGRYYLQYAAPGTEYNVYANGVYVGAGPLGPFDYAPYNPVAYKPGGFVEGAGHGSTFEDNYGNWWNSGTPWIGYNWTFERRIAIFPARFDADGQMEVSTRFGDFPHYAPTAKVENIEKLFTGWMLLSYRKPAAASSVFGEFSPGRATDENPRTFWVAGRNEKGETLTVDLGAVMTVRAVQVNFADYKAGRFEDAPDIYTEFMLEASTDGAHWRRIARTEAPRRDRPDAYFELRKPAQARYVRYVHGHIGGAHLAIADLRVFGAGGGAAPSQPRGISAARDADGRVGHVAFTPVDGAVGYNIRWGVKSGRLSLCYQVFADSAAGKSGRLDLRSLNIGVDYWVAVEAFNENGVSDLSATIRIAPSPQSDAAATNTASKYERRLH